MSYIGNTNITQGFIPAIDYFSGNASTTAFTLSRPVASVAQVQVTIDNVAQNPSSAYTVSANTITFTSAPLSGTNNIYVYYTSPITQVIAPGQGTVTATSMASSTGTGAGVFQTSPTITTPVISSLSSASATALTLQSAGTTAITVDASQNVGIGISSPTAKLTIEKSSDSASPSRTPADYSIRLTAAQSNTYNGGICVSESTYVNSAITPIDTGSGGAQGWSFITGNNTAIAEAMRIDSSGNLLVGVTSTFSPGGVPTTTSVSTGTAGNWALGIRHTSSASNPYGLAIQYPNSAPNAVSAQFIFCQDSAGTKFDVRSNGGIGNYSANNVNLSDQREKKNIELAGNYLNKICQIPVKTFLFNDQTDDELNLGAIAQEVQAVCPELITESNWGTEEEPKMRLSIYQTDLQYALMKSIQELKAINDTQAETINALTARIVALENR